MMTSESLPSLNNIEFASPLIERSYYMLLSHTKYVYLNLLSLLSISLSKI